ncbi:DUF6924 domain-containing protein [Streptomyces sp. NPDC056600]|uniref:DUF6924 domain-containing protein n=1 Tax=Streptomyces sp. NPDC056600 TaxID=3345874 RepID=UPI003678F075
MPLPPPDDLASTVLRTDFADDTAWAAVREALDTADGHGHATCVSDPRFTDVPLQALIEEEAAAEEEDRLTYVFLADATTLADPEFPLLAVDLHDEPGRTFRVPARWYPEVSANLSIANADFADFADAADAEGWFRGWGDAG